MSISDSMQSQPGDFVERNAGATRREENPALPEHQPSSSRTRATPQAQEQENPAHFSQEAPEEASSDTWQPRLPHESNKAYAAHIDYCLMGVGRSLRKLHEVYLDQQENHQSNPSQPAPPTRSQTTIFDWSRQFEWPRRAEAYDREEMASMRSERRRLRAERQQIVEQREWTVSQKLIELGEQILEESGKFHTSKRRVIPASRNAQGQVTAPEREIITVGIKVEAAMRAVELGMKMARMASGLPLEHKRHDLDVKHMGDAELLDILESGETD